MIAEIVGDVDIIISHGDVLRDRVDIVGDQIGVGRVVGIERQVDCSHIAHFHICVRKDSQFANSLNKLNNNCGPIQLNIRLI